MGFPHLASSYIVGWSPISFFSETGDSFIRVCCEGCIHQLVLFTSTVYCLRQLCIVYVNCVLFTSIVYCLHQLCIVYVNCVLFASIVYCLRQLCIVYVNCVLFTSIVYCLRQLCIVYINCVLFTSTVYCLHQLCIVYVSVLQARCFQHMESSTPPHSPMMRFIWNNTARQTSGPL